MTVENHGSATAHGVAVVSDLSGARLAARRVANCRTLRWRLTCELGDLERGASVTLSLTLAQVRREASATTRAYTSDRELVTENNVSGDGVTVAPSRSRRSRRRRVR